MCVRRHDCVTCEHASTSPRYYDGSSDICIITTCQTLLIKSTEPYVWKDANSLMLHVKNKYVCGVVIQLAILFFLTNFEVTSEDIMKFEKVGFSFSETTSLGEVKHKDQ